MKHLLHTLLLALVVAGFLPGCDALNKLSDAKRNSSQGAPYEVVVICTQPQWESALGDTLRVILRAQDPYLNSAEPLFSLFQVTPRHLTKIVSDHRNRIDVDINPNYEQASAEVQYDVASSPQIVVTLKAPSEGVLTDYLSENRESLEL